MPQQPITHHYLRQLKPSTARKLRAELQRLAANPSQSVQRFIQQMRERHPEMTQ